MNLVLQKRVNWVICSHPIFILGATHKLKTYRHDLWPIPLHRLVYYINLCIITDIWQTPSPLLVYEVYERPPSLTWTYRSTNVRCESISRRTTSLRRALRSPQSVWQKAFLDSFCILFSTFILLNCFKCTIDSNLKNRSSLNFFKL